MCAYMDEAWVNVNEWWANMHDGCGVGIYGRGKKGSVNAQGVDSENAHGGGS